MTTEEKKEIDRIKRNEANKRYYQRNKENIKKQKKEYAENNKDKLKEYRRIRHNKKMATDSLFKLKKNIRTAIGDAFRNSKLPKNSKTTNILGCSFEEFKVYLESKFEPWMTWDNHGKYNGELNYGWDIDHITPICNAITDNDIIKLSHYTNFQPLCSYKNRVIKRNK